MGASNAVVLSPGSSVTGTEWDSHTESRSSSDFAPSERRGDRLFGTVVNDGLKDLQLPRPSEGRSSFFQQVRRVMPASRLAVVDIHLEVDLRLVGGGCRRERSARGALFFLEAFSCVFHK